MLGSAGLSTSTGVEAEASGFIGCVKDLDDDADDNEVL